MRYVQPSCSPYAISLFPWQNLMDRCACALISNLKGFKGLNKNTVKDRYSLQWIQDLFDQLQGAKVVSTVDLLSATDSHISINHALHLAQKSDMV